MLMQRLLSGGVEEKLYSDDVFQSYVRTGIGASQTVTTGIAADLVISKSRSGATDWAWYDKARGVTKDLVSNSTAAETTQAQGLTAFSSTGHTWGTLAKVNTNSATYVDFALKKAPKFFDVVTYTGNGVAGRQIPHSLGVAPGMIVVKATSNANNWCIYHKNIGATGNLRFDTAAAEYALTRWNNTEPAVANFTVGSSDLVNQSGWTYVAYLFAHDPSADGIIQCGSFTTDASGNATVNLGWEPQYLMSKVSSATSNWWVNDSMRGLSIDTAAQTLIPNLSNAEVAATGLPFPTATGLKVTNSTPSGTIIYLAIRRPNKPPTTGTQVYNAIARTGTGAAATVTGVGFAPDLSISHQRDFAGQGWGEVDRLRGPTKLLRSERTDAEADSGTKGITSFNMDGVSVGLDDVYATINFSGKSYINHFFKRAPGFFDVVCYTGTGVARTVPHSLGVAPELIIVKKRSGAGDWKIYPNDPGKFLEFTTSMANITTSVWNNALPTSEVFFVKDSSGTNETGFTYVAYLFASLPGISKIGNYTGNGASQTINCGFTTGARFILIKRTDAAGDWYIWDTVRGIVAGNDPHLSLNTTVAEVTTDDSVDPYSGGFAINQVAATNINVTGASYIFLSVS